MPHDKKQETVAVVTEALTILLNHDDLTTHQVASLRLARNKIDDVIRRHQPVGPTENNGGHVGERVTSLEAV